MDNGTGISEADARVLRGVDASRRAGWAKYYSMAEQVDELSRDYNLARGDADQFQRAFSYIWGFASGTVGRAALLPAHPVVTRLREFEPLTDPVHAAEGESQAWTLGTKFSKHTAPERFGAQQRSRGIRAGKAKMLKRMLDDGVLTQAQYLGYVADEGLQIGPKAPDPNSQRSQRRAAS